MSACEQELCPFWAGDAGCPCATLEISEHDRRRQQRALGIAVPWADPDDEYGDEDEGFEG